MPFRFAQFVLLFLSQSINLAFSQNSILYSKLSSECVSLISNYPPTVSLYASEVCHVCQGLGLTPSVEPCCSKSNPTACFASSFYGKIVTDAGKPAPITVSGSFAGTSRRTYFASTNCDSAFSIEQRCAASSPGFTNLCFHQQQSCLCSASGKWAGPVFDNHWSSCLAWAETANPSEYSLFGPNTDGVVQSRKCQTFSELTATGGTPSNCLTSASNTLSSTSLQAGGLPSATSSGAARENAGFIVRLIIFCAR